VFTIPVEGVYGVGRGKDLPRGSIP